MARIVTRHVIQSSADRTSSARLCYPMTGRPATFSVTRGERWPSNDRDLRVFLPLASARLEPPRRRTTATGRDVGKNQVESSASGFRKSFDARILSRPEPMSFRFHGQPRPPSFPILFVGNTDIFFFFFLSNFGKIMLSSV